MPRLPNINSSEYPYHVTIKTVDKKPFPIPLGKVWKIFENYLYLVHKIYKTEYLGFVLMNNHIHLIASAPMANISEAMGYLFREVSKEINRERNVQMKVFGNRFYRSLITNDYYLTHAYKYIYRNPIRAGISKYAETYKFSTLSGILGNQTLVIPIYDPFLFDEPELIINWINKNTHKENDASVKSALKKPVYKYTSLRSGAPNPLDINDY